MEFRQVIENRYSCKKYSDRPVEPEKLEARLSTLQPGLAIWSAKRMGGRANETLRGLLTSADENTRKHAAFALAITGDASGVELLREMARERDPVMLHDCRKRNQQRGCMAVYFLGRLADAESVGKAAVETATAKAESELKELRRRTEEKSEAGDLPP